jgi:hypothetical protein
MEGAMKKTLIVCMCVLAMGLMISTHKASADPLAKGWHNFCTIETTGQLFNRTLLTLTCDDHSTPKVWVVLNQDKYKELLAVALTAESTGAPVRAWVMDDSVNVAGVQCQTLYGLMLIDQP